MNIPTRPIRSTSPFALFDSVLPADYVADKLKRAGVTRERAHRAYVRLFERYGRFPANRQRLVWMDALQGIAIWG